MIVKKKLMHKRWFKLLLFFICFLIGLTVLFYYSVIADPPQVDSLSYLEEERIMVNDSFYLIKNNWLKKSSSGLWELYLEGKPFERGVYAGKLSKELLERQEAAFIDGIRELVPSHFYLNFLKYFVAWYNRKLPDYIPEEYQQEIYGMSMSAADAYDFIGPKFQRKLNYHAAHDIGHALQNMGMVSGCTALAAWDTQSADSSLIMGRNFDFYVGDEFAEIKIIAFIKPDQGYPFTMITWPGMMGAVSGMNRKGLTVTLNAGPASLPGGAKMPVTILARKILQYAATIEEAQKIAAETETFVSECIIVGSGSENSIVVIEKTPEDYAVYESPDDYLVCSNHFQSEQLADISINQDAKKLTSTVHRYQRMEELFNNKNQPLTPSELAHILRNIEGVNDRFIGLGNEMAVNQLLAHHSVIFKPKDLIMWVAASPSQLGAFVAYDLKKIFKEADQIKAPVEIITQQLNIPPDSLLFTEDYQKYLRFKALLETVEGAIEEKAPLPSSVLEEFRQLNPEHYLTYLLLGDYYQMLAQCPLAQEFYDTGLTKAIPWKKDQEAFLEGKAKCNKEN